MEPRTLIVAAKKYSGIEEFNAHDALADCSVTLQVFDDQCKEYGFSLEDAEAASKREGQVDLAGKLKLDKEGRICYAIGKAAGIPVKDDSGFGIWMLGKSFPEETKGIIKKELGLPF